MKKLLVMVFFTTLMLLVGCSDTSSTEEVTETPQDITQETKQDTNQESISDSADKELEQAFIDYVDSIRELAPEEERLIGLYDSVTGDNYTDDEELYYTLSEEIIPGYLSFINDVEEIVPNNREIRDIHEKYIGAINTQNGAFTLMLSAIENQDYATITEANGKLDEARRALRDYLYDVEELANRIGVNL